MSYFIVILVPILLAVLYMVFSGGLHTIGKLLFALLAAARLNSEVTLVAGSGFLNYAAWAGIFLALCFLTHWLPRASRCMDYSSAYFFVAMFSLVLSDALIRWLSPETTVKTIHFLLLFLFSAICTSFIIIFVGKTKDFSNWILRGVDRVLACAIMGFVISYSGTQIFSYVEGTLLFWILAGVFAILWFPADLFAFDHILIYAAQVEKEYEEEQAAKLAAEIEYASSPEAQARMEKEIEKDKRRDERRREREKRRSERDKEYWERKRDRDLRDEIARYDEERRREEENRRFYEGW